MFRKICCLFAYLALSVIALAQTPVVNIPLTITDDNTAIVMHFGLSPSATDTLDASLGELPLPPMPPTGVFDSRFMMPAPSLDASLNDYRNGTSSFNGSKEHHIAWQLGEGTVCRISYALPLGVSARLQDEVTGSLIDMALTGTGSYTVTYPTLGKLKMTVTYALMLLVPAAPVLLQPQNAAMGVATNPKLTWAASTGATQYILFVSDNSEFTTTVFYDSTLTDTSKQLNGLAKSTTYFWKVSAKNASGRSAFSNVFSFTTLVNASTGSVIIPITVTDDSSSTSLTIGLDASATDGIDYALGEAPLPPVPPAGVFDARLIIPNGDASFKDYRQGTDSSTAAIVYHIQYQLGSGKKFSLSWNLPAKDTARLQDEITGALIDVPMVGSGNYTLGLAVTNLKITVNYKSSVATELINHKATLPEKYALHQNYPNPFNPSTILNYDLPAAAQVTLKVYDVLGHQVANLVDGFVTAGIHEVQFSAANLTSGLYFARFEARLGRNSFVDVRKMLLMK